MMASLLAILASEGLLAIDLQALARGPGQAAGRSDVRAGAVAVIPMVGPLMGRGYRGWGASIPGMDSYRAAIDGAARNPDISAIVLEIDSPGGTVAGTPETAATVKAAAAVKPVVAVANGLAASAAYWIASQASEVVIAPSGEVGSIGIIMAHQDMSKLYERMGVQTSLITAGTYKAEASPYGPLTPEARANLQARVDASHEDFVSAVAAGRRVSADRVKADFGQGRTMDAADAVRAGMADRIASLDTVIAELLQGTTPRAARRRADSFAFA